MIHELMNFNDLMDLHAGKKEKDPVFYHLLPPQSCKPLIISGISISPVKSIEVLFGNHHFSHVLPPRR